MIIVIKNPNSDSSFVAQLKDVEPDCREYVHLEKNDDELIAAKPSVIILAHGMAVSHCQSLKKYSKEKNRYIRIIVILEQAYAHHAVDAKIAGADSCLVMPIIRGGLPHAVSNEINAVRRWYEADALVSSGLVINNRYKILKVLGIGLRASILLAADQNTGKEVTIKLLRKMLLSQPGLIAEFIAEGEKFKAFHAPSMVEILDVSTWNNIPFLVLNIGEAKNLYEHLQTKKLQEVEIYQIGLSLTRALITMKNFKVLHFNIKPENILCVGNQYFLSEYGLLPPTNAPLDNTYFPYWSSSAYSSPEFFSVSASLTARSDVYSLGVLLYTIAVRQNPFLGYHYSESLKKHLQKDILKLGDNVKNFTPSFKFTMEAMTVTNQESRPRLRDLEIIFNQAIALHTSDHSGDISKLTYLSTTNYKSLEKGKTVSDSGLSLEDLVKTKKLSDETLVRLRAFAENEAPRPFKERIKRYCKTHPYITAGIIAVISILFVCGFLIGKAKRPIVYYKQGQTNMFTCYNGHTMAKRTLDFRTVYCEKCGELTSPSYTCRRCRKVFGTSLWPLKDMTEAECLAFEEKLKKCPYCDSYEIFPTKVPQKKVEKKDDKPKVDPKAEAEKKKRQNNRRNRNRTK